ncbi:convertase P-domain protein [Ancylostoma duodenale]|uniref:Convertase P-domain protein n=1 Tax=Ancylostoma duodenale TaxID=51022 RepID=A0A0C2CXE2_9BILA|nr:convertase P-domain protein [Ancylostoma duodenale]
MPPRSGIEWSQRHVAPEKCEFLTGCKGTSGEVNFSERVQIAITAEHPKRGQIALFLTSPSGTTVQLLHPRKNDDSPDGLSEWPFVSVGYWGENPQGKWKLEAVSVKCRRGRARGRQQIGTRSITDRRGNSRKGRSQWAAMRLEVVVRRSRRRRQRVAQERLRLEVAHLHQRRRPVQN